MTEIRAAVPSERYLDTEHPVACTVAEQEGRVVGLRSLKRAWIGNFYDVAEGWGIIGTHIHPDAGRGGVGRRLFVASLAAAETAGLRHIAVSGSPPGGRRSRAAGLPSGRPVPERLVS